jgi:hypothetical protein
MCFSFPSAEYSVRPYSDVTVFVKFNLKITEILQWPVKMTGETSTNLIRRQT